MKGNSKSKTTINQTQKKERENKSQKESKPKKEKKSESSSLSLQLSQMITQNLLFLERFRRGETELSLNDVVTLENIPQLMKEIYVPIYKMSPQERLEYLRTLNLEKTEREVKENRKMND